MPIKNKEKRLAYQKQWRINNKKYFVEWRKRNIEKSREATRRWRLRNKKYCNEKSVQYHKERPWLKAYNAAINRCSNPKLHNYYRYGGRGIKMFLTREEVKILWDRDNALKMKRPTLDRKQNDGNYTFDNCQFIPMSENVAKSNRERRKIKK